ncbi:MAG: hypothetical protein WCN98_16305 [Verrucomicrobiaceae bacterium]
MKSPLPSPSWWLASKRQGMALVIVLLMLVLMAVLLVAFVSSVRTELVGATSYAAGADVRNLGDSAIQIAQSQIAAGTKGVDDSSQQLLWASQPGMIRTWTTTGNEGLFYKLYSSGNMVVTGAGFSMATEVPPNDWATMPERYVDLNAPVLSKDGNGTIAANGSTYTPHYPIMDPAVVSKNGANISGVEGFEIDNAPGYVAATYPPDATYNPANSPNPAAMPALGGSQWLIP